MKKNSIASNIPATTKKAMINMVKNAGPCPDIEWTWIASERKAEEADRAAKKVAAVEQQTKEEEAAWAIFNVETNDDEVDINFIFDLAEAEVADAETKEEAQEQKLLRKEIRLGNYAQDKIDRSRKLSGVIARHGKPATKKGAMKPVSTTASIVWPLAAKKDGAKDAIEEMTIRLILGMKSAAPEEIASYEDAVKQADAEVFSASRDMQDAKHRAHDAEKVAEDAKHAFNGIKVNYDDAVNVQSIALGKANVSDDPEAHRELIDATVRVNELTPAYESAKLDKLEALANLDIAKDELAKDARKFFYASRMHAAAVSMRDASMGIMVKPKVVIDEDRTKSLTFNVELWDEDRREIYLAEVKARFDNIRKIERIFFEEEHLPMLDEEIVKRNIALLKACREAGFFNDAELDGVKTADQVLAERAKLEETEGKYTTNSGVLMLKDVDVSGGENVKPLPVVQASPIFKIAGMQSTFQWAINEMCAKSSALKDAMGDLISHLYCIQLDGKDELVKPTLVRICSEGLDVTVPEIGRTEPEHVVLWAMLPNRAKEATAIYGPDGMFKNIFEQFCLVGGLDYKNYGLVKYLGLKASDLKTGVVTERFLKAENIFVCNDEVHAKVTRVIMHVAKMMPELFEGMNEQDINDGCGIICGPMAEEIGIGFHQIACGGLKGGILCLHGWLLELVMMAMPNVDWSTWTHKDIDGHVYSFNPTGDQRNMCKVTALFPTTVVKFIGAGATADQWIDKFCNAKIGEHGRLNIMNYGQHVAAGYMSGQQVQSLELTEEAFEEIIRENDAIIEMAIKDPSLVGGQFSELVKTYPASMSISSVKDVIIRTLGYRLLDMMAGRMVKYDFTKYICPDTVTLLANMLGIDDYTPGLVNRSIFLQGAAEGLYDVRRDPLASVYATYLAVMTKPNVYGGKKTVNRLYPKNVMFYGTLTADKKHMTVMNMLLQSDNDGDKCRGCAKWYVIANAIIRMNEKPLPRELGKLGKSKKHDADVDGFASAMTEARLGSQMGIPADKLFTLEGTGLGQSITDKVIAVAVKFYGEGVDMAVIASVLRSTKEFSREWLEVITWLLIDMSKHGGSDYAEELHMLITELGDGEKELWKRADKKARKALTAAGIMGKSNVPNVFSSYLDTKTTESGNVKAWFAKMPESGANVTGLVNRFFMHVAEKFTTMSANGFEVKDEYLPKFEGVLNLNDFIDWSAKGWLGCYVQKGDKTVWETYVPSMRSLDNPNERVSIVEWWRSLNKRLNDIQDMKATWRKAGMDEYTVRAKAQEARGFMKGIRAALDAGKNSTNKRVRLEYAMVYNWILCLAWGAVGADGKSLRYGNRGNTKLIATPVKRSQISYFDRVWDLFADDIMYNLKANEPECGYTNGVNHSSMDTAAMSASEKKLYELAIEAFASAMTVEEEDEEANS